MMFETIEAMDEDTAMAACEDEDSLREELLNLQFRMQEEGKALLVVLCGVPGSGRGRTLEKLLHWVDARSISVHAARGQREEERQRPRGWRWWIRIPAKGRISVILDAWVQDAIDARVEGRMGDAAWERFLHDCNRFEEQLHQEGVELVKIWLHLSGDQQQTEFARRLATPEERWNVAPRDLLQLGRSHNIREVARELLQRTSTMEAPWTIVPAAWNKARAQRAAHALRKAMERALERPEPEAGVPDRPAAPAHGPLRALDLTQKLDKKEYRRLRADWSAKLRLLVRLMREENRAMILAFEGMDAAGKGGNIRRLTDAIDPRWYDIHPVSAPNDVERAHPWLWRFWQRVPKQGKVAIFDRSWYGRVLVERIEGFCRREDWERAWEEIRDFETQLVQAGQIVGKFWIHIDADEQLQRFKEREEVGYKRHKLTDEDWRNREKWDAYEGAAAEMLQRTHGRETPWFVIAGNDKYHARIQVLESTCRLIAQQLGVDLDALPDLREPENNGNGG